MIEPWDDTEVFSQLGGEPAFTLVPSMSVSGVLTVVMSALLAVVAVRSDSVRHPGTAMALASLGLFAVGGGVGPPLVGVVLSMALGLAGRRVTSQPGSVRRGLARSWRPLVLLTALAYLGLFPGTVLLHWWFGLGSAALVAGLTAAAFLGLALTLPAARAQDRLAKGSTPPTGSAAR